VKATEITAGLAESNGSLLPGIWRDSLHVTCGLTACTPGSAPGPTLGNEYGKTVPYLTGIMAFDGGSWLVDGGVCVCAYRPVGGYSQEWLDAISDIGKLILCLHVVMFFSCLQCFDTVGWAAGRASGL